MRRDICTKRQLLGVPHCLPMSALETNRVRCLDELRDLAHAPPLRSSQLSFKSPPLSTGHGRCRLSCPFTHSLPVRPQIVNIKPSTCTALNGIGNAAGIAASPAQEQHGRAATTPSGRAQPTPQGGPSAPSDPRERGKPVVSWVITHGSGTSAWQRA